MTSDSSRTTAGRNPPISKAKTVKTFIFDFDGTIADTFHHALRISNRLAGEFHYREVAPDEIERLRDMTSREILRHLQIPMVKLPLIAAKAERELLEEIATVRPVKGLAGVLRRLKSQGIGMGILTSNSVENVTRFLKHHRLELFDFVSTSSRIWGKTRRLKSLIRKRALTPQNVLYIGDETRDITSAHKAGIRIAAVTWGYNSRTALEAHRPDYLLAEPEELLRLCGDLG